jgi:hypothetical protein
MSDSTDDTIADTEARPWHGADSAFEALYQWVKSEIAALRGETTGVVGDVEAVAAPVAEDAAPVAGEASPQLVSDAGDQSDQHYDQQETREHGE